MDCYMHTCNCCVDDDSYPEKTKMDTIIDALNDTTIDDSMIIGYVNGTIETCVNGTIETYDDGTIETYDDDTIDYTELLKYACRVNRVVIVRYLLKNYRKKIHIDDGYTDYTALMYSVVNESMKNIKMLIKCGADVNMCTIMDETALDLAIKLRNKPIIRLLLVHGSKMTWKGSVDDIKIMLNLLMY